MRKLRIAGWLWLCSCDATVSEPPPRTCPAEVEVRRGPPNTRREDVVDVIHGREVHDPYRWLERGEADEVLGWTRTQNTYARAYLDPLPYVDAIKRELSAMWRVDAIQVPVHKRGDRYFYGRRHRDRERVVYYVREGVDGPERVLLDPDEFSSDGSLTIKSIFPSPDGKLVAYTLSRYNADQATLRIRDVKRGRDRSIDAIEGGRFAQPQWTPDSKAFYYTHAPVDPAIPPERRAGHATIRRHVVGRRPSKDDIVFGPTGDPRTIVYPQLIGRGRYLVANIGHGSAGGRDIFFKDLERGGDFVPLLVGASAPTEVFGDEERFYLYTSDGAPRYRIVEVDPARPLRSYWRDVVPEREHTLADGSMMHGHFVLSYLDDVRPRVEVVRIADGQRWPVAIPPHGAVSGMFADAENDEAMIVWSSLADRPRLYRVPLPDPAHATTDAELWEAEDDRDTEDLVMHQRFARSADGTAVPVFVLHRRDVDLDGTNPTVLYGYGGFGINVTPRHDALAHLWARHGGVWAVASLRGGGEYGEDWHRAGKVERKPNVFADFIAAAEMLVDDGYTSPAHLGIYGGSNGGLLVGAAMTQRPDLFGAVVCQVPLLDMVRYHRFEVAPFWIDEYGSADDPRQFDTLFGYSPYHRITAGTDYPALLMVSTQRDDRVDPLHARKFVAAMQAAHVGASPILFRNEPDGGHGGPDAFGKKIDMFADSLAFFFAELSRGRAAG